jgi:glycosyltransferase involved in cell wall biosynthesis
MMQNNSRTFVTTLGLGGPPQEFEERAIVIMMPDHSDRYKFFDAIKIFFRTLKAARGTQVLVLNSASGPWYPDIFTALVISFWKANKRPAIVLVGDMWEPHRGIRHSIDRLAIQLADRAVVCYVTQSSDELDVFPKLWGIDRSKMCVNLYFWSFADRDLEGPEPPPGNFVFAGGNAHRDYHALVEAARALPEIEFVIAAKKHIDMLNLPPNVKAGPVPHEEFVRLMRSAKVVVTPIQQGLYRAAGQQTYLNGMMLGKPTIVNDTMGVGDHLIDGKTGWIVDGSPEGYIEAIRWVFDPANQEAVECIARAGQRAALEEFSYEHYTSKLLEIVDGVFDEFYPDGK